MKRDDMQPGPWTRWAVDKSENEASAPAALGLPGLQLYTVRSMMAADPCATLTEIALIGYKEVEFHDYFGLSAPEIVDLLDTNGLTAPAAHVSHDTFESSIGTVIEHAKAIGHRYLVYSGIPDGRRQNLDDYGRLADLFNGWGATCKTSGLQFVFHNHEFEFADIGGRVPYDLLLESSDPDLVAMELDLFWIRKAGRDPLPYFEKYPGRFKLCHVKDMDAGGEMTEVGSGTINFASDFDYADLAGFKHFFVEHDNPADALASITESFEGMKTLLHGC